MNDRPSDELTGKLVAEQFDLNVDLLVRDHCNKTDAYWFDYEHDSQYERYHDPRTDTDAALRLLHYMIVKFDDLGWEICVWGTDAWHVHITHENRKTETVGMIPISGEPFRYAVVSLMIETMGIKESPDDPSLPPRGMNHEPQ